MGVGASGNQRHCEAAVAFDFAVAFDLSNLQGDSAMPDAR
jgi:hypothetical protein